MTTPDLPRGARLASLLGRRALVPLAAVALGLGVLAAACAPSPGRPGATARPMASPDEVEAALAAAGATGPAVAVWTWTPGFVEGDPGAAPLAHAQTWVAPTGTPSGAPTGMPTGAPTGTLTGTVTVWQDPAGTGAVELAARDDDVELAAALGTVGPDDTLVTDRSDWLVVTGDRVRSLLTHPRTELVGTVSVTAYRTHLAERAARDGSVGAPGGDPLGG